MHKDSPTCTLIVNISNVSRHLLSLLSILQQIRMSLQTL